jgi:hypothetical protein
MNDYTPPPLEAATMAVLPRFECQAESMGSGLVRILDSDGNFRFLVSPTICAIDMQQMLNLYDSRFRHGVAHGQNLAFSRLRALIGAAPIEPLR